MIGSLAFIAVGEQQDHGGPLVPFLLGGGDEFIGDRLGAVDEVAELRLPQDEGIGAGDRVAVLEPESSELRQQRVIDEELALLVGKVLQWKPVGPVDAVDEGKLPAGRPEQRKSEEAPVSPASAS